MGIWGPGLFDDDEAADLRSGYPVYLADAQSDTGATDLAASRYDARFDDPGATTTFWLALALLQHRAGRLDPRVQAAALSIIDGDLDLRKWTDPTLRKKRAKVLETLRRTLVSPPPPPKPLPKPIPVQLPDWRFSEVVGYRLENGRYALLHVMGYGPWSNVRARAPIVSILNWFVDRPPSDQDIPALTYLNHGGTLPPDGHLLNLAMPAKKALRNSQFEHLGLRKPVTRDEATSIIHGIGGEEGRTLDQELKKRLWPYWEDATRPAHVRQVPAEASDAEARRLYEEERMRLFGR